MRYLRTNLEFGCCSCNAKCFGGHSVKTLARIPLMLKIYQVFLEMSSILVVLYICTSIYHRIIFYS